MGPEHCGHATFCTTTEPDIGFFTRGVAGMTPLFIARSSLAAPAKPAAVSVCPKLPLVEPTSGIASAEPYSLRSASSSHASPCGVPVAWHSMYCSECGSMPKVEYVFSMQSSSDGMCGLSGWPVPALVTHAPTSVP